MRKPALNDLDERSEELNGLYENSNINRVRRHIIEFVHVACRVSADLEYGIDGDDQYKHRDGRRTGKAAAYRAEDGGDDSSVSRGKRAVSAGGADHADSRDKRNAIY